MLFEFATANRIIFGPGALGKVGIIAAQLLASKDLAPHALVLTGKTPERADPLVDLLAAHNIVATRFAIPHEPTTHLIQQGATLARESNCQMVIGFGGGSVIDAAKATGALLTNQGSPLDYLEVIGKGQTLTQAPAPTIAILSTSVSMGLSSVSTASGGPFFWGI